MDARRIPLGLYLVIAGCTWNRPSPPVTPASPPTPEPAAVAAATEPVDESVLDPRVKAYLDRLQGVAAAQDETQAAPLQSTGVIPASQPVRDDAASSPAPPAPVSSNNPSNGASNGAPAPSIVLEATIPIQAASAAAEPAQPAVNAVAQRVEPAAAEEPDAAPATESRARTVAPPVVKNLSVRAASEPLPPASPGPSPGVNAAVSAAGVSSLKEAVERWIATDDGEKTFRRQLDARLLAVVTGDYERARRPLDLATQEQQALAQRYIESIIAIREAHQGDLSGAASSALGELGRLSETLRSLSDLRIPVLRICRQVRGFGQYEVIDPATLPASQANEFVLYCEAADFRSDLQSDGQYLSRFDLQTTVLNRAGEVVLKLEDPGITDLCRNRRRDCFIPRLISLPASLAPGEYVVKVTLHDRLAEKIAQSATQFRLTHRTQ